MKRPIVSLIIMFVAGVALAGHSKFDFPLWKVQKEFWQAKDARIGVGMTETPSVGAYTQVYDSTVQSWQIQDWDMKMPKELIEKANADAAPMAAVLFGSMRKKLVRRLQELGFTNVVEIPDVVPAPKDYRPLKEKYSVDMLVLLTIDGWGTLRSVPQNLPEEPAFIYAFMYATTRIIRLDDNHLFGTYHLPYAHTSDYLIIGKAPNFVELAPSLNKVISLEGSKIVAHFGEGQK